MRQEHAAADDRRARGPDERRRVHRRHAGQRRRTEAARRGDGVPELRALPAQDGAGEHRVPAEGPRCRQARAGRAGDARPQRPSGSATTSIVGPASSAAVSVNAWRWHGPSSVGRRCSAWTSRCRTSTPSCAARREPSWWRCTRRLSSDVRVRHPRPGRGDDDGHARRGDEPGTARTGGHAPEPCTPVPASVFVAQFIGTPADERAPRWCRPSTVLDRPVVVGVRPEHLVLDPAGRRCARRSPWSSTSATRRSCTHASARRRWWSRLDAIEPRADGR